MNNTSPINDVKFIVLFILQILLICISIKISWMTIPFMILFLLITIKYTKLPLYLLSFLISWDFVIKYSITMPINIHGINFVKLLSLISLIMLIYKIVFIDKRSIKKTIPLLVIIYFSYISINAIIIHGENFTNVMNYFNLFIYFILIYYFIDTNQDVTYSIHFFIIGNLIPSIAVLYNQIINNSFLIDLLYTQYYYKRPLGFIGNPNAFGLLNLLSFVLSFYLLIKNKKNNDKIRNKWLIFNMIICLTSLFLSGSRGTYIALLIALGFIVFELKTKERLTYITLGVMTCIIALSISTPLQHRLGIDTGDFKERNLDDSYNIRIELMKHLKSLIGDRPFIGNGPTKVYSSLMDKVGEGNPQNTFLSLFAGFGILAMLLFIGIIYNTYKKSLKIYKKMDEYKMFLPIILIFLLRFLFGTYEDSKILWFTLALIMSIKIISKEEITNEENKITLPN